MNMTKRTIVIDLDTELGNKLYWFLKVLIEKYPDVIMDKES